MFIDGSCDQHPIKDLRRAGWGGATLGADGKVDKEVFGCVPSCYPQTSQGGEHVALVTVGMRLIGPSTIASDCANVVRDWNAPSEDNGGRHKAYSQIIAGGKAEGGCTHITGVRWVKAHQSQAGARLRGGDEAVTEATSNDAADAAANVGRLRHEQPSARQLSKVKTLYWHSTVACRVVAAVLPHWPRLKRSKVWEKPAGKHRGVAEMAPEDTQRHTWACGGGKWHCTKCLQSSKGHERPTRRQRELCPGRDDLICERAGGLGHVLWETTCEAVPLFLCSTCGNWMEQKSRLLGEKCLRLAVGSGKGAIKYIFDQGKHPKTYKYLDCRPTRYRYCEEKHGPSKHAVRVRRLVRRKTRECKPWQETESDASERNAAGDGLPESLEDMHGEDHMQAFLDLDAFDHGVDDFFGPCAAEEREDPASSEQAVGNAPALQQQPPVQLSTQQAARAAANRAAAVEKRDARSKKIAASKAAAVAKRAARYPSVQQQAVALRRKAKADARAGLQTSGDVVLASDSSDEEPAREPSLLQAHTQVSAAEAGSLSTDSVHNVSADPGARSSADEAAAASTDLAASARADYRNSSSSGGANAEVAATTSPTASSSNLQAVAAVSVEAPATRRTAAPAGLFGFVAKALGVPPGRNVPVA